MDKLLQSFNKLEISDSSSKKYIAILGDPMTDVWIEGDVSSCQEGCPKFAMKSVNETPGGSMNAARQLDNWNTKVNYITPILPSLPTKRRFTHNGKIIFREDSELHGYGLIDKELEERRRFVVDVTRCTPFDGVLVSDYDKGFVNGTLLSNLSRVCAECNIPFVCDPKRTPHFAQGSIIKCNSDYLFKHLDALCEHRPAVVLTLGSDWPLVFDAQHNKLSNTGTENLHGNHNPCVNHVGAGDSFAAHLILGLAHGLPLRDAALIAHAAGKVYVKHPFSRPPWPHEIAKQLDPVGGKCLLQTRASALRRSISGRIVFTNGVFRIPHAGHAWLLKECGKTREVGDTLVIGINDDRSAASLRPGEFVMPLAERLEMLAGLECVDWIIPFAEATPWNLIRDLKPDVLIKGHEYQGQHVPGDDLVTNVQFTDESPYPVHCQSLVESICENSRN